MLLENDTLSEDNPIFYIMAILAMIGSYDIMDEILKNSINIFSTNIVKKTTLWAVIYLKTKSIFYASFISIIIVLAFPKIFFGKISSPRLERMNNDI